MEITWRKELYGWRKVSQCPFTTEEFVALNKGLRFTKYDPEIIKRDLPLEACKLDGLFPGFKVYQFNRTSAYRSFPLRIIYSSRYTKVFELLGTNEPFYDLMRMLRVTLPDYKQWRLEHLEKYILLFFDNVAGRHGRFELLDFASYPVHATKDEAPEPAEQLINRVNNYHSLEYRKKHHGERTIADVRSAWFKEELGEEWYDDSLYRKVHGAVKRFFRVNAPGNREDTEKETSLKGVYMTFNGVLFSANISVSFEENSFGVVSVSNEEEHFIVLCKDENGSLTAEIIGKRVADERGYSTAADRKMLLEIPFLLPADKE